jgi:hypothetical protein
MSLQLAAQHLAAQGRGTDTTLVHMSKPELMGLQALAQKHGTSLSTNPTTGLPEAGVLDSILPMIAGVGLAMFAPEAMGAMGSLVGGGAAAGAGLTTGLASTLMSGGNIMQGLTAGLGAYGGAGLGSGLMSAGAQSLADKAAPISALPTVGAQEAAGNMVASPVEMYTKGAYMPGTSVVAPETIFGPPSTYQSLAQAQPAVPTAIAAPQAGATLPTPAAQAPLDYTAYADSVKANNAAREAAMAKDPFAAMKAGLSSDYLKNQFGGISGLKYAGAALAPAIMDYMTPQTQSHTAASDYLNTVRPYSSKPTITRSSTGMPQYNYNLTPETPYVVPYAGGGLAKGPARGETLRGTMGTLHGVEHLMHYAGGGISNLGSYSDGGQLLRGPGDGVSDSIPAQIGQNQPARLAEGEFVVPARIVSELGNGSTDAGAKKLYGMLDRIQAGRAKTTGGGSAYAKNTNADRYLPA